MDSVLIFSSSYILRCTPYRFTCFNWKWSWLVGRAKGHWDQASTRMDQWLLPEL